MHEARLLLAGVIGTASGLIVGGVFDPSNWVVFLIAALFCTSRRPILLSSISIALATALIVMTKMHLWEKYGINVQRAIGYAAMTKIMYAAIGLGAGRAVVFARRLMA